MSFYISLEKYILCDPTDVKVIYCSEKNDLVLHFAIYCNVRDPRQVAFGLLYITKGDIE